VPKAADLCSVCHIRDRSDRSGSKIRDFAAAMQGAQVGVFFCAGHGHQVSGHKFLVPVDAQLSTAARVPISFNERWSARSG
jgi:uncharacterized caspase-like protein